MVERAILSQSIVDYAGPPQIGEKWIADTKVRGFGLRVWRRADGSAGKAYCVRASDQFGKLHRRTLDITSLWEWRLATWPSSKQYNRSPSLGRFVQEAREWARDTVDQIKERPTLDDEEKAQLGAYVSSKHKRTLRKMVGVVLRGYAVNGASQSYIDRLDKLFFSHVPLEMIDIPVSSLTEEDITKLTNFNDVSPGNVRFLRPFLGRIFEFDSRLSNTRNLYYRALRIAGNDAEDTDNSGNILSDWQSVEVREFFDFFLVEEKYWQQALCLYFYFSFYKAPLSQVMAARWDQFYELKDRAEGVPNPNSQRNVIWCYREDAFYYESVSRKDLDILLKMRNSSEDPYLFPSQFAKQFNHIKSVDHVWGKALQRFKLSYVSPRQFKIMLSQNFAYKYRHIQGKELI